MQTDIDLRIQRVHDYIVSLCKEGARDHADQLLLKETEKILAQATEEDARYLAFRVRELRRQLELPPCKMA